LCWASVPGRTASWKLSVLSSSPFVQIWSPCTNCVSWSLPYKITNHLTWKPWPSSLSQNFCLCLTSTIGQGSTWTEVPPVPPP
jgi:hypothetical protein